MAFWGSVSFLVCSSRKGVPQPFAGRSPALLPFSWPRPPGTFSTNTSFLLSTAGKWSQPYKVISLVHLSQTLQGWLCDLPLGRSGWVESSQNLASLCLNDSAMPFNCQTMVSGPPFPTPQWWSCHSFVGNIKRGEGTLLTVKHVCHQNTVDTQKHTLSWRFSAKEKD